MFMVNTWNFLLGTYFLSILTFPLFRTKISSTVYAFSNGFFLFLISSWLVSNLANILYRGDIFSFYLETKGLTLQTIDFSLVSLLTPLSFFFILLVATIGLATNIYTLNYFKNEADELSFLWILNGFIASMMFLVISGNFYSIFLGWELIGLTSFFLINFWHVRRGTLKSSLKAFTFNLVSDIFLLASFIFFYLVTNSTNINILFCKSYIYNFYNDPYLVYGVYMLIISAGIKSVQICGHLWLPDSMEAPVPASSLIHSATLVSAGVYLLCKFSFFIQGCGLVSLLSFIGCVTAAYGGVVAASQTDLKKLLAYSTMSHCGFLWVLASCGDLYPVIVYLYLHGFLKAVTFFCSGSFIRSQGTQDSRLMGIGSITQRLDSMFFIFSSANLAGLPMTLGYFYKFFFFTFFVLSTHSLLNTGLLLIGMLSSLFYFYRLVYFVIFDYYKNTKNFSQTTLLLNKISFKDIYGQAANNHFFAVYFIYCVTFFFCLLCYKFGNMFFEVDLSPSYLTSSFYLDGFNGVYDTFFIYFYMLYLLSIFIILLWDSRYTQYFVELLGIFTLCLPFFFILKL